MKKTIMLYLLIAMFVFVSTGTTVFAKAATPTPTPTAAPEIKTAKELEKYLRKNFGKLKTKGKTFNLKDHIFVIENEDETKCFDIAIVVDWSVIASEDYKVQSSIVYTKEQKKAFNKALKNYQKKLADAVIETMPDKKVRGGYLDYGYKYPYLKKGYYEGAVYGWKNYDYITDSSFPWYDETEVADFNWHEFNEMGDPFDMIK